MSRFVTLALITLALFTSNLPAAAQQIDACLGANGKLRVLAEGEVCKDTEKFVAWNITGPQGPAGPAGTGGGLQIEDASERVVGVVVGTGPYPTVMLRVAGTAIQTVITPEGFYPQKMFPFYAGLDCSGDGALPVADHVTGDLFYEVQVGFQDGEFTFPSGPAVEFAYQSRLVFDYPNGSHCQNGSGWGRMKLLATVAVSTLGFQPPFVLRGLPGEQ